MKNIEIGGNPRISPLNVAPCGPHSLNMAALLFPVSKSRANCHVGAAAARAGPGVTTSGSRGGHTGRREDSFRILGGGRITCLL